MLLTILGIVSGMVICFSLFRNIGNETIYEDNGVNKEINLENYLKVFNNFHENRGNKKDKEINLENYLKVFNNFHENRGNNDE